MRTFGTRAATILLASGLVLSAVALLPWPDRSLDRHVLPRELLLVVAGLGALLLCALGRRRLRLGRDDALLLGFVGASGVSALIAVNPWMALRAMSLTLGGVGAFMAARHIARAGRAEWVLGAAAVSVALLAAATLLESYGVLPKWSMHGRAPSGMVGNRNFMAHSLVLGGPLIVYLAMTARRRTVQLVWTAAFATLVAALVLSRCRAAWLATAAVLIVACALYALAPRELRSRLAWRRGALLGATLVIAAVAAVVLPNRLSWGTDGGAYTDTISRLGDYRSGTGRGRIIQYRNTIEMATDHPLLGVGPGNWSIEYPRYASPGDPSHRPGALQPVNRLPNTDWLGMLAERGAIALAALLLAFALMGARALRALRRGEGGRAPIVLLALVGLGVMGTFDAVLLRPGPTLLLFAMLGAATPIGPSLEWSIAPSLRRAALSATLVMTILLGFRAAELIRFSHIGATNPTNQATLRRALEADPGSYAVLAMLAATRARVGDCPRAVRYGQRALALHPNLDFVRRALVPCTGLTAAR